MLFICPTEKAFNIKTVIKDSNYASEEQLGLIVVQNVNRKPGDFLCGKVLRMLLILFPISGTDRGSVFRLKCET